jgi:hypothetical protein
MQADNGLQLCFIEHRVQLYRSFLCAVGAVALHIVFILYPDEFLSVKLVQLALSSLVTELVFTSV